MIRNETVSVDIGGTIIYPKTVTLTRGVGKGYNTAKIDGTNLAGLVGDSVTITLNGDVYSFVVDAKHHSKNLGVSFDCVGLPATLNDGQPSADDFIYTDSDDLIEQSRGTITVVNNIPTIDFTGQTYSKASTAMSRILDMVNVIGGEAYEIGGTLHLEPLAVIPLAASDYIFVDADVFDYSYSSNRDSTVKAKDVLINPITDDLYSDSTITLDFTDGDGKGELYFNPSLTSGFEYSISGVVARVPVISERIETFALTNETSIMTLAGIDTIDYMTLDGEPILVADYTLYAGYNIARFHAPLTGEVAIKYQTLSVTVYPTATTTVVVKYQCALLDIVLEVLSPVYSGACSIEIGTPFSYEDGTNVLLSLGDDFTFIFIEEKGATNLVTEKVQLLDGGGTLTIKYLYTTTDWLDKAFMNAITSLQTTFIEMLNGTVIYDSGLLEYVVFLDKPIDLINDIYYGNQALSGYTYNDTGDVPYVSFLEADLGKTVDISANVTKVDVTIPPPTTGHPVTILDVIGCGGVSSAELSNSDDNLCDLPATFSIDVAGSFSKTITEVVGKVLTGAFGNLTVDNKGEVTVTVSTQGTFEILCDAIKVDGVITVDSVGVV